jgi:AcrR family transcriptional regulator
MRNSEPRKYRASEKRKATKEQNRAAIEAAAWEVFCTIGLDAANIRDIVNRSGVSRGTFYNYFRTKEAIFEVLAQDLLDRIRTEVRAARTGATGVEQVLSLGYECYLNLLRSLDGALDFIDRNRHHIRSQVYSSAAMSGLSEDLEEDLRRFLPPAVMSKQDRALICSIVIAAGAEAVFHAGRKPGRSVKSLSEILTKFAMRGLSDWLSDTRVCDMKVGRTPPVRSRPPGRLPI